MTGRLNWRVEETRSGNITAFLNGFALHSRFNPVSEAQKAAAGIPAGVGIVVLAGFGLGYVAEAIIESAPGRPLVIAEADKSALIQASEARDIEALLKRPEIRLLAGGDPRHVCSFLTEGPPGAPIYFMPWRPAMRTNPEWYTKLEQAVNTTAQRRRVNAHTLERFGHLWVRNLAANRTVLPMSISIDAVRDAFEGIPALILAGGPSLDDVLPHLKELSERFLLIAVDTALQGALRKTVIPDIVAAVDPQYWNTRHLDWCRVEGAASSIILAESATHPAVFRTLSGRCIMTRTRFPLGSVLENAVGLKGELDAGGSVSTAAWEIARHFGCTPIIAAGLDLGYPGRKTHYRGSLASERPHLFSRRDSPAQNAFFHALHDAKPHTTEDMDGHLLLTDRRMDIYHAWFTEHAMSFGDGIARILGGSGRYIKGMTKTSIDELLNLKVRRKSINKVLSALRETPHSSSAQENLNKAMTELALGLERLKKLARKGMNAAAAAKERMLSGKTPDKPLAIMAEVDESLISGH
ncbi:MAG: hypothetical protein B6D68_02175, partial [spirochete symbiont of Stewartia floridana]